jgi:hypothetical protein
VPRPQGVRGLVRGLARVRLLRPRRAVHPRSSLRVWAPTAAPQPEQHPADGGVRGNVRGVLGNQCPLAPFSGISSSSRA